MKNYRITTPKSVLILGSGGQKIGQAGEYDSAGAQAIKALKAEGIRTILINPNMTAVQTSEGLADAVYFLPVSTEFVTRVIEKEKPDSIIVNYGGKTAFGCALDLESAGVLERHNIQVLGTSLSSIRTTAERDSFMAMMRAEGIPVPGSAGVEGLAVALEAASRSGYPVMARSNFCREDGTPAVCENEEELKGFFASAPEGTDVTVEEWLGGWKEIEFEILRDAMDNCVLVCSMENVDPLGIHTGDSLVVAPCQTLTNREFEALRDAAFRTARALEIIGMATVRFAKDPSSPAFRLFEVNARVSRSTAIASKATGIPIGYVAARVMLGFSLSEIENPLTGSTRCCAEPSFDYLAVKVPRWDLGRFSEVDRHLGSGMKSVGEALAFGRTFAEALQKAIRMANPEVPGIACHPYAFRDVREELRRPTDLRVFAAYSALAEGWTPERVRKHSGIDRWFIDGMREILDIETELRAGAAPGEDLLRRAKRAGFSDEQIALCVRTRPDKIRALRKEFAIRPVVKQVDSVAAEYPSRSNVLYMTYNGVTDDAKPSGKGALVVGAGPYHIGSSLEYDWCCASALATIRKTGHYGIMVNCNPESATTDADSSNRLYFEELSLERILDIYEAERPDGLLLSYGGQGANDLAVPLSRLQIPVLGTNPTDVDRAGNRSKFSALLEELGIPQPAWAEAVTVDAAADFAAKNGYPVLLRQDRPSSGAAMSVAWDGASLKSFLAKEAPPSVDRPVIVSSYVENSKEIEIDAVADKGKILVYAISEHIENEGVHSGDATVVLPAQRIYLSTAQVIKKTARRIAEALGITGPFNIQFLAKSANVQVIECDLRAGRSFPFCSKVFRTDMVDLAVRAQLGMEPAKVDGSALDLDYVGVRAAQFSYSHLKGADPVAGIAMASTGEVGCLGRGVRDAFMKAMLSTGFRIPEGKILLSTGPIENKVDFIDSARKLLSMGYELVASGGTARFLQNNGIPAKALAWPLDDKKPNIADALRSREIGLVINIPKNNRETELRNDYIIRRLTVDCDIPLITNIKIAKQFTDALEWYKTRGLEIKSREEYGRAALVQD